MSQPDPDCRQPAGLFKPVINPNRCEGKESCVAACPYDVFTMGELPVPQRKTLSLVGWMKGYVHNWHQAFATNADACRACGLCVSACPEKAITLQRA